MKLIQITLSTTPTNPKNYNYRVDIQDCNGTWNTGIYFGRFFCQANQSTVTLDLDDLLYDWKYKGIDSIKPVMDVVNNQYSMPTNSTKVITDYYYNKVRVVSTASPVEFTSVEKSFWFTPNAMFDYEGVTLPLTGRYITSTNDTILPHIPANAPTGFTFGTIVYNVTNASLPLKRDTTTVSVVTLASDKTYYISLPLTGATEGFYLNDVKVCAVDQCTKPYYLLWLANNGALQCQGFLKTSEYSATYTNKNRVDMHNTEWNVTATAKGIWKLKSTNLKDDEYTAYGEMFNSPYLVLLDMENSRLHYVNIKSTTYKDKKRTRKDNKPIYFEVDVQSAENLRV